MTDETAPIASLDASLRLVDQLDHIFSDLGKALAAACASDGRLDEERFDAQQVLSYEFALAAAELQSARDFLKQVSVGAQAENAALAQVFAGKTLPGTVGRMEAIAAELGHSEKINGIRQSPDYLATLESASPAKLAVAGARVCAGGDAFKAIATNDDVDMAREMFVRFARDAVAPLAEEIHRRDLDIPDSLLRQMADMGVFGLSIPEKFGGSAPDSGENTQTMIAVTEALSEASLGAGGSLITRPEILARAILAGGTEDQKADWLPRIASGETLAAISITEPDHGSDAASLKLKASKVEGGWVLNGAKTWCTFAGKADVLMVVARTGSEPGFKGLSILLVEKPRYDGHEFDLEQGGGGRVRGRAIATIGYRGMHSFEMSYEDFFVPDSHVLGEEAGLGRGFYFTMNGMTGGRIQTAARASGVMMAALSESIRYANDRVIFGKPLSQHQLTQSKIATMAARFMASRALAYNVAKRMDAGGGQMEASLAKLFACRSAEYVTREAVQIHGGMGYAEEYAVSRYFVDARVLSIFEGAEETLALRVIARGILGDHLKAAAG
ncbi:acyl-CoA dehydrogenase family protein [Pontixanthobacter aestiaquae]|uniref:Acyl-CoA dehydrogenase n=1 Tax=Pontixanthobacter aestiaquae TaxID=1509367 RepID=A0A844Z771_9SPHN|nr:acyl-CoA dehydrogenase family protein [Pontixanthobacter aestiaquae]MDN3647265.1 acyl-CoA dehydrogenase family protein [Pontixanthobacter aestiaquae]MXO81759.1 acyl-CoA dehydrogenase [Pontixanthobacter aestiaquae]